MSELPTGWESAELNDIALWGSGGTPSRTKPEYFGGDIPWVTISDLTDDLVEKSNELITKAGLENSAAKLTPAGSILVALYGSIGKLGIASKPLTTNQAIAYALPNESAYDSKYLFNYLQLSRQNLLLLGTGVTQKNIYIKDLKSYRIPLAPRPEQTRIVAKLEELLSELDAGVAELKAAQKKLAQYRQSLLKAAVDGSLTAEWRKSNTPAETGAQLLERILKERRARWEEMQLTKFKEQGKVPPKDWQKKYPEPVQPDITDLPKLPKGWAWASLEQISEIQGGIQKQPNRPPVNNKFPFLRVANVARGKLKLDEIHEIELFPGEFDRLQLITGDVLIVEGNGSLNEIGRCAVWDGSIENAVHQNHLIRVRPITVVSQFLETWLNSLGGIEKLTKLAATTSGLYTLSVGKISKIPVPIAPVVEQMEATRILIDGLASLSSQEQSVEYSLKQAAAQRQNILRAAFAGELVPQDPHDEPASVLLERIRAERIAQTKPKTRGQKKKQPLSSRTPPIQADASYGNLYKPHA